MIWGVFKFWVSLFIHSPFLFFIFYLCTIVCKIYWEFQAKMRKNIFLNSLQFFNMASTSSPPKQCWVVVWTFLYVYEKFQHYHYQTYIRQTTNTQTGRKTDMRTDRQTTGGNEKVLFLFFYWKVILNIWANSLKNSNIVWGGGGFY